MFTNAMLASKNLYSVLGMIVVVESRVGGEEGVWLAVTIQVPWTVLCYDDDGLRVRGWSETGR